MSRRIVAFAALALSATAAAAVQQAAPAPSGPERADALAAAIAAPTRTEANRPRDRYRHPYETLTFFGVRPNDTVVEIWPGGGWYTEILAPYLRSGGGSCYGLRPTGE